ncbi:MAG: sterol desaturase family protein [Fimbriimonadaceae bacterium]
MPPADILRLAAEVFAGGIFFVLVSAMLFWPLEELFESDKHVRPSFKDLAYLWFYQSYGLWIGAGIVFEIAFLLRGLLPGSWVQFVHSTPFWVQAVAAFVMAEIWVYIAHRLSHKSEFLWQFHKVHHTVLDMTWSAASRAHPVDFFLTIVGANLPALALGIDLTPIALFVVLERFYTVLLHANLRWDWGWFSRIIASPCLHREHHMPRGNRTNYAGILSLLDWIGRTYKAPGASPATSAEGAPAAATVQD